MRTLFAVSIVGLLLINLAFTYSDPPQDAEEQGAEPLPIKEVMNEVMKGGLQRKIVQGTATDEEKMKFLDMLIHLVENDPPQGDPMEWKMAAGTAMMNAAKIVTGREGAQDAVKASTNCAACHNKFKPE